MKFIKTIIIGSTSKQSALTKKLREEGILKADQAVADVARISINIEGKTMEEFVTDTRNCIVRGGGEVFAVFSPEDNSAEYIDPAIKSVVNPEDKVQAHLLCLMKHEGYVGNGKVPAPAPAKEDKNVTKIDLIVLASTPMDMALSVLLQASDSVKSNCLVAQCIQQVVAMKEGRTPNTVISGYKKSLAEKGGKLIAAFVPGSTCYSFVDDSVKVVIDSGNPDGNETPVGELIKKFGYVPKEEMATTNGHN